MYVFIYSPSESHKVCSQIFHTLLLLGKLFNDEVRLYMYIKQDFL